MVDDDDDDKIKDGPTSKGNGRDDDDIQIEVIGLDEGPSSLDSDEATEAEALPSVSSQEILGMEKQIEELRKEKDEMYDRLLRKHADFENFRKRIERDKREFQTYVLSEFFSELLVILDNFERALLHSDDPSGSEYRKGIELIYRQLRDTMEKKGLKAIQTQGQPFDPNFHEAIAREQRNDLPENTILDELQKGYMFQNKLLRPAMVKVSYHGNDADSVNNNEEPLEDTDRDKRSEEEWENNES
jgi:molecular chaperone GrpE